MSIRWKLLTVMLVIAVTPVAVTSWLNIHGLSNLGSRLAQQMDNPDIQAVYPREHKSPCG